MKTLLLACSLAALSAPALAQDGEWTYRSTVYLWFAKTNTTVETIYGTVETELSFGDALEQLDFTFMGALEAQNGKWSIIGDLLYMDLTTDNPTPQGLLFSETSIETKMTAFSGYALYRVHQDPTVAIDLGAGFRVFSTDLGVTLSQGLLPTTTIGVDETWVDPLLAGRALVSFSDDWYGALFMDVGGFGAGSDQTWQVVATVGYRLNEKWSIQGGYRYLDVEKEIGGTDTKIELSGPILGAAYHF